MVNKLLCWFVGHRWLVLPSAPAVFMDSHMFRDEQKRDVNLAMLPPGLSLGSAFHEIALGHQLICSRCGHGLSK
jgi:hypothetical protein